MLQSARLDAALGRIQKEYADANAKHAHRKHNKVIPRLFYSFYKSPRCTQLVSACQDYCMQWALLAQSPDHDRSAPAGGRAPPLALQQSLQRVSECWSAVLMYRSEMNQVESAPSARSGIAVGARRAEHFLNDTFDYCFFETLYLLVEYRIEAAFSDYMRERAETISNASSDSSNNNTAAASNTAQTTPSPSGTTDTSAVAAEDATRPPTEPGAAAAPSVATTTGAATSRPNKPCTSLPSPPPPIDWRLAQPELQRLLRSRSFTLSSQTRVAAAAAAAAAASNRHNNMATPRGGGHGTRQRSHLSTPMKMGASHRLRSSGGGSGGEIDAAVSAADAAVSASLDDDVGDSGLAAPGPSYAPGQFKSYGGLSVLECLGLRSPLLSVLLPSPLLRLQCGSQWGSGSGCRSRDPTPDLKQAFVFGSEPLRGRGRGDSDAHATDSAPRPHGRLTHAEDKYLRKRHALQKQRALEWKMKLEREEREDQTGEEKEDEQIYPHHYMDARRMNPTDAVDGQSAASASQLELPSNTAVASVAAGAAAAVHVGASTFAAATIPALQLPLQPRPPSHLPRSSSRPLSPLAAFASHPPLPPPSSGSFSARSRPLRAVASSSSSSPAAQRSMTARPSYSSAGGQQRMQPLSTTRAPTTLDQALVSDQPIVKIVGNRISLVDFRL